MRNRSVRNRLDLLDCEDPQVGKPTVETDQRVVIGADMFRWPLASDGEREAWVDVFCDRISANALCRLSASAATDDR
jgi:hypothetical protein